MSGASAHGHGDEDVIAVTKLLKAVADVTVGAEACGGDPESARERALAFIENLGGRTNQVIRHEYSVAHIVTN